MTTLVCFLEEPSAREMLKGLLPRILPEGVESHFCVFEGKTDLESKLTQKMRLWSRPDSIFFVLEDQDSKDCREVKNKLVALCADSGKERAIVRIACRELESFYLGDLQAVESGLEISGIAKHQERADYRIPDSIMKPSEVLRNLTKARYQKVKGSRAIGPHLNLSFNRSSSFMALISALQRLS